MLGEFFSSIFSGATLAFIGAFLAVALSGIGSAKGVGSAACAADGMLAEQPSMTGKVMILEMLPATQGLYGFVIAFLIIIQTGLLGGADISQITVSQGANYLIAALPVALTGLISAQYQAKAAIAGINLIAKRKDKFGVAMMNASLVELYAILGLLISIFLVFNV